MRKTFLIAALFLLAACSKPPPEPAVDIGATVQAAVEKALLTATHTPLPDFQATVHAGIAGTMEVLAVTPSPTLIPEPTATQTSVPNSTHTPTDTPTSVPTSTHTPTATSTPPPSSTPSAAPTYAPISREMFVPLPTPTWEETLDHSRSIMLELINREREKAGVSPLRLSDDPSDAQSHAQSLMRNCVVSYIDNTYFQVVGALRYIGEQRSGTARIVPCPYTKKSNYVGSNTARHTRDASQYDEQSAPSRQHSRSKVQ